MVGLMQYAKKLTLVVPKFVHQWQMDRECKQLQRPKDALANIVAALR